MFQASLITIKHFRKVLYCLLFCYTISNDVKTQTNLVPNSSFEQYTTCPDNSSLYTGLNSKPDFWYKPDARGAGYLNACANSIPLSGGVPLNYILGKISYQPARTGNAYIGMYYINNNVNNYFQIKLLDSLKSNNYYYGECYVNLANTCNWASNNQSILFTKNSVYVDTSNTDVMLANPQITNYNNPIIADTTNWIKVSGRFKATGGEKYLTLGNFHLANNTQKKTIQTSGSYASVYYVDDVAVYALDSFCLKADAGRDTSITIGDSAFIGSYTNGIDSLQWLQNGILKIDTTRPGFWVHPLVSTCYVLTQTVNGFTSSDTVCVTVKPLPLKFISYTLRQAQGDTPSSLRGTKQSVENIWQTSNEINTSHFIVQRSEDGRVYKSVGKVAAKGFGTYEFIDLIPTSNSPLTIYYRLIAVDKDGSYQFSEVKQITIKLPTPNISIYPNPAKLIVTIDCKDAKEISIIDYLGKIIKQFNNPIEHQTINIKQFLKGIYMVKVVMKNGDIKTEKLVIE